QAGGVFGKTHRNRGLDPGERAFPDSFFPSFRPAGAELTNRGNRKISLMKTNPSLTRNLVDQSSCHCGRVATLLIALALACFALSPPARAVDPPPDGGYPGFNTAEGDFALLSLTTGERNTAIGYSALFSNTTGVNNTACGVGALIFNTIGNSNTAKGFEEPVSISPLAM